MLDPISEISSEPFQLESNERFVKKILIILFGRRSWHHYDGSNGCYLYSSIRNQTFELVCGSCSIYNWLKINYIQRTLPADTIWWMNLFFLDAFDHCSLCYGKRKFQCNCFILMWVRQQSITIRTTVESITSCDEESTLWNESHVRSSLVPMHCHFNLLPVNWFINFWSDNEAHVCEELKRWTLNTLISIRQSWIWRRSVISIKN